jgi:D-tyrosyl-tRNA(Tyr) deacylase
MLILLGVETGDSQEELDWLARKVAGLRIFSDAAGQMNLDLADVDGRCLVISQFTLLASTKKGKRPSYIRSARPEEAIPLYETFVKTLGVLTGTKVETGVFGADMQVSLVNDGPVTITIDTRLRE